MSTSGYSVNVRTHGTPYLRQSFSRQIVGIDCLRLVSALLVVGVHLGIAAWLPERNGGIEITHAFDALKPWLCFGWVGVQIFFVISGFVIAYSVQRVSAPDFARNRFLRLYPIAFMSASITLLATELYFAPHLPQTRIWASFLRVILFIPTGELLDDSFWTLPIEACFYLVVYLLLLTKTLRWLTPVMSAIGTLSAMFWTLATTLPFLHGSLHAIAVRICNQIAGRNYTLIPHGCYFALGVLMWECLFHRVHWRLLVVALVCILGGILEIRSKSMATETYLRVAFPWQASVAIWLVAVAVIAFSVLKNAEIQDLFGRTGNKIARMLGLITYPLYLLHYRVGTILILLLAPFVGFRLALTMILALLLVVAYILAMHLDPFIQGRIKRVQ